MTTRSVGYVDGMGRDKPSEPELCVEVTGLAADGSGVAEHLGVALHIAGALPGDRARVRVEHRSPHRPQAFARLEALERPSPRRRDNPCPHAPDCAGCPLIGLDDEAQLLHKRALLAQQLAATGVPLPEALIRSEPVLGYRRRAKYVVFRQEGRLRLGAFQRRSHRPTPTESCPVVRPAIRAALPVIVEVLERAGVVPDEASAPGLRYLQLRANHLDQLLLTLVLRQPLPGLSAVAARLAERLPALVGVTADLNDDPGDALLSGQVELLWGQPTLREQLSGCEIELDPYAFCQLHGPAGERLARDVAELVSRSADDWVADLYAGVGAIGLQLARQHPRVVAVERLASACRAARRAAQDHGLALSVVAADSATWLEGMLARGQRLHAAVVDPPRRGLSREALEALLQLRPAQLIYVSCHPPALARDLAALQQAGYRALRCLAYDLFPQTPQIEVLVELQLGGGEHPPLRT